MSDPPAIWARLLQELADKPAMSWVRAFDLRRWERGVVLLTPQPGKREIVKFVTGEKRDHLAKLLRAICDQQVRVEIDTTANAAVGGNGPNGSEPGGAFAGGGGQGAPERNQGSSAHQQALNLPLVKQVLELFDVSVLDVRPEEVAKPPMAGAEPAGPTLPPASGPATGEMPGMDDEIEG